MVNQDDFLENDNPLEQNNLLIQATEKLYKLLVDSVKDYAIFMLDPAGRVLTWNTGAECIKGYTAGEIIGKHFSQFYPLEAKEIAFPQQALEIAGREGSFEHEGWRVRKDGSLFWANVVITAVRDQKGQLIGFAKVTRDLTRRKGLEEALVNSHQALKQSEARYRLLIDNVKDYAIFMLTPEGHVATWNIGAQRIKGYRAEEIIGQHFSLFYPVEVVQTGFPAYELRKALGDGRFEDEGWRVRKDGSRFWANVVISPLYDEQQIHIGFAKVTRDLSQQLRNEELTQKNQELLQINRDLDRVNKDLDNFVYAASHDLKAPILNLEGLLKALEKRLSTQTRQDQSVEQIYQLLYRSVARLKATIGDLTEVARIGKENQEDVARIPIADILTEVQEDLESQIQEAGAHIEQKLNCPDVHFSRKNLKSIFYNLLSNALKYRSPDRPLKVVITCQTQEEYYVLSVQDNGLGMDMRHEEKIFALFKRLHSHVEGTGVGLYMVKKMIENAGGRIRVESQVGVGSTFQVYFKQ